jgi:hypothetical protein
MCMYHYYCLDHLQAFLVGEKYLFRWVWKVMKFQVEQSVW